MAFTFEETKKINNILATWNTSVGFVSPTRLKIEGHLVDDRFASLALSAGRFCVKLDKTGQIFGPEIAYQLANELDELRAVLETLESSGYVVGFK